jgi:hypothetical protein
MCISPQSNRTNFNNYFKTKQKITKKTSQRGNFNKIISNSTKLSSRNAEKRNNAKNISHKRIISNNPNINDLTEFLSGNNSSSNINNIINKSHNLIFNNYNINSPHTTRLNMQDSSSNLFLNRNILNLDQNYFKINHNNNYADNSNHIKNKIINNCKYSYNNNNDKITKIEINNINYNNGKNIIIKNLLNVDKNKDNDCSYKMNKIFSFPTPKSNIDHEINNNKIISSFIFSPISPTSRHLSNNSSTNILYHNNRKISNFSKANSSLNKNNTNSNFFSKIQKNKDSKRLQKINSNINEINLKKNNIKNEVKLKNSNSNLNDKIIINNNKTYKVGISYVNNILLNDLNKTEKNKKIRYLPSSNDIKNNKRNSTDIKKVINKRKIIYSIYDDEKKERYINQTNIDEDNGSNNIDRILFTKDNTNTSYSHFFYENNRNNFKNNYPEENHFQTIAFLQKMKFNNFSIK